MPEKSQRVFDSEIIIDEKSRWYFRGNEITLDSVLSYFKENLDEDENGIFILNTYGELSEKGYVSCMGYPLKFIDYQIESGQLFLLGDNKQKFSLQDLQLHADLEEKIFFKKKGQKYLKYSLNRDTHSKISEYIEEENGNYFLKYANHVQKITLI